MPDSATASRNPALTPPGRRFWVLPVMDEGGPRFSIRIMASVFFGRSPAWVRALEESKPERGRPNGAFLLDGKPMEFERDARGARAFRLSDIEPMAFSLHEFGLIEAERLNAAIQIVIWVARQHKILPYEPS